MLVGYLFYFWRGGPQWARTSLFMGFLDQTPRRTTVGRTPGRVISPTQGPLPDNTQQSQQTDIHATGGIGTHNLSKRASVDLMLVGYTNFKLRYASNLTRTLQVSADWPHALLQVHSTRDLLPAETFQVVKRLLTISLAKPRYRSKDIKKKWAVRSLIPLWCINDNESKINRQTLTKCILYNNIISCIELHVSAYIDATWLSTQIAKIVV